MGDERKFHWCTWNTLCLPKDRGGLGFKRLRDMNLAMLSKLGWKILNRPDLLWVQIIMSKYGPLLQSRQKQNTSAIWWYIRSTVPLLQAGLESSNTLHDGAAEGFRWKNGQAGKFSVACAYELQISSTLPPVDKNWMLIWKLKGPGRLNLHLWRIRRNFLPTGTFLLHHHMMDTDACPVCGIAGEDGLHALRDCSWVSSFWRMLLSRAEWGRFFLPNQVAEWVDTNLGTSLQSREEGVQWSYVFREAVHTIWFWRNKILHESDQRHPPAHWVCVEVLRRVKQLQCVHNITGSVAIGS